MQQQTGTDFGIGGILFNERAGRQDGGFKNLFKRHTVIEIFDGVLHHGVDADGLTEVGAGSRNDVAQPGLAQRLSIAIDQHMQ